MNPKHVVNALKAFVADFPKFDAEGESKKRKNASFDAALPHLRRGEGDEEEEGTTLAEVQEERDEEELERKVRKKIKDPSLSLSGNRRFREIGASSSGVFAQPGRRGQCLLVDVVASASGGSRPRLDFADGRLATREGSAARPRDAAPGE